MSLLLLFGSGQGTAASGLNLALVASELLAPLGAEDFATLGYWSESELYQLMDEGAKRLARTIGGFVERDASTTLVVSTHTYSFPARHLSTLHMSLGTTTLKPRTAYELAAYDDTWVETASATVTSWLQDSLGTEQFRAYPIPAAGATGAFALIFHRYPATITSSTAVIQAPKCAREYFFFHALGEARGMESKAAVPEVAEWCGKVTKMIEGVFKGYLGGAQ